MSMLNSTLEQFSANGIGLEKGTQCFLNSNPEVKLTVIAIGVNTGNCYCRVNATNALVKFHPKQVTAYKFAGLKILNYKYEISLN